jgi:hypothetical protein
MKRRCACGTTFAHHQSHFRHVKRCATHARWLEQGGVFELGAYDGNLKLDEVVETAASATDAFYRVALYLFADGAFNCNRSVRVAANGGGWRVRRRRRVGDEQPTSWEWEVIDDGAAVAAEVRAVVVAALKDVMEAQVPGSQLGVKACAAMNTAHDAPRLMRVLRERRVEQHRARAITLDAEEQASSRVSNVQPPPRAPRALPAVAVVPRAPSPPPRREIVPPSEVPCLLCARRFVAACATMSAYDTMLVHLDKCALRPAWAAREKVHALGHAHATFLACSARQPDPLQAFSTVFLSAPAFTSVRMRHPHEMCVRVRTEQDEWEWARATEHQIPGVLARMRDIIRPLVGEVPATDEQLVHTIIRGTSQYPCATTTLE